MQEELRGYEEELLILVLENGLWVIARVNPLRFTTGILTSPTFTCQSPPLTFSTHWPNGSNPANARERTNR